MTPSTNKCCERMWLTRCTKFPTHSPGCKECAGCGAHHGEESHKPTEPSVCDVRVQTAEGVNIPCRLPRPCKDHEKPSEVCGWKWMGATKEESCALQKDHAGDHQSITYYRTPKELADDTPQQKEESWERFKREANMSFGVGIHDVVRDVFNRIIRTEIAQAEKRSEVRALEWVLELFVDGGMTAHRDYDPNIALTGITRHSKLAIIKDRLTVLKNPTK